MSAVSFSGSYFDDETHFAQLLKELDSWVGTPYVEGAGKKHRGADCVRFVEAVLVNIGAIQPVSFPKYVTRGGGERMLEIFLEVMDGIEQMDCIFKGWGAGEFHGRFERGDVLLISSGKALHHLSIVATPPVLWHCLNGVSEGNLFDPIIERHLRAVYRVKPR